MRYPSLLVGTVLAKQAGTVHLVVIRTRQAGHADSTGVPQWPITVAALDRDGVTEQRRLKLKLWENRFAVRYKVIFYLAVLFLIAPSVGKRTRILIYETNRLMLQRLASPT